MPINLKEDSAGGPSAGLSLGMHDVAIAKVLTLKDGKHYKTSSGARKVLIIFESAMGDSAVDGMTVEGDAVWKLARLLSVAGLHDEELAAEGINEYTDFLDQKTAERILVGKQVRIKISERVYQGRSYSQVDVVGPSMGDPVQPREIGDIERVSGMSRDDIPF